MTDTSSPDTPSGGPLAGLTILDMTRILAGPTCTQLLGDLGADVIKIERPGRGDDTRGWGPPFLAGEDGDVTTESAYFLSANRSKRSVAINLAEPGGRALIADLAAKADILIENFKTGHMTRLGLDYAALSARNPRLIFCSITGFGQTGPYAHRPGYDFLVQGMGGVMSITGDPDEEGGRPVKVGVGVADIVCGLYASTAMLAALEERRRSGLGQYIDVALYDSQIAWLVNQAQSYLIDGQVPGRLGNAHPTIVPYESFPSDDGSFIIAVGNDGQFARLCAVLGVPDLAVDQRFLTNADRVRNRKALIPLLCAQTADRPSQHWIDALEKVLVPCGPVNDIGQVFDDPQTKAREMRITMEHASSASGTVDLVGSPVKMSRTPISYRHPPPRVGEHTEEVLRDLLDLDDDRIGALMATEAIGPGQA